MRVVIVGQKWLGAEVLERTRKAGYEVTAVSAPGNDRLGKGARVYDIPNVPVKDVPECDVIVAAYAHVIIPDPVIAGAKLGAIGYHPSLLPRHRGKDSVRWTIASGDPITGGTVYWLTGDIDGGPIAAQDWCFVRPGDTAETLWRRDLAPMGVRLIISVLKQIEEGTADKVPQLESVATWEPSFDDGKQPGIYRFFGPD